MSLAAALLVVLSASAMAVDAKTIPRTIIQTSKDAIVDRSDWVEYRDSLKRVNPDFDLVHYSDDEARAFIAEHYAGTILADTYDIVTPIMRADIFRLAAIYKLGGFYMDMDVLGKSSLDPLVEAIDNEEFQAVFPKEWWISTGYYASIYPGRTPEDNEDHWQMGQYAFGVSQLLSCHSLHAFLSDLAFLTFRTPILLLASPIPRPSPSTPSSRTPSRRRSSAPSTS